MGGFHAPSTSRGLVSVFRVCGSVVVRLPDTVPLPAVPVSLESRLESGGVFGVVNLCGPAPYEKPVSKVRRCCPLDIFISFRTLLHFEDIISHSPIFLGNA